MASASEAQEDVKSTTTGARLSAEDRKLLDQLESCVDRMRKHTPDEPYILTIPQDEPRYHHFSRHSADLWLAGTPFSRQEHPNVQYQTFFYHEPHSDLFHLHRGSQFHKATSKLPDPEVNGATKSGTATPNLGPKKKISLAAYKNKQSNNVDPTSAETVGREKAQHNKVRTGDTKARAEQQRSHEATGSNGDTVRNGDTRRERAQDPAANASSRATKRSSPPPPSSPKRARQSSPAHVKTPSKTKPVSRQFTESAPKAVDLPSRLSPLHLPARLSPTLPANIIASLEARQHKQSATPDNTAKHDRVSAGSSVSVQEPGIPSKDRGLAGISSPHDSTQSSKSTADDLARKSNSKSSIVNVENERPSQAAAATTVAKPLDKSAETGLGTKLQDVVQSHIVILRISKQHRNNFSRLLRMQPRPNKDIASGATQAKGEPMQTASKGIAREVSLDTKPIIDPPTTNGTLTKRQRPEVEDSQQPQPKRKKVPERLELNKEPSTPLESAFQSPLVPSSTHKSHHITATPRKEMKSSTAMTRIESSDGLVTGTPITSDLTPSNKTGAGAGNAHREQPGGGTTRPSPASGPLKTAESNAWWDEYQRFTQLAKSLKKAGQDVLKEAGAAGEGTTANRIKNEKATLICLESLCAFMLSFDCYDKSYGARDPPVYNDPNNWSSLHAFWRMVADRCKAHKPLFGVANYLGIVYNGTIIANVENGKHTQSQQMSKEAGIRALKAARDAESSLPLHVLINDFPKTWRRFVSAPQNGPERERPGRYDGRIAFPFGLQMSPAQAVRTSLAIMTEYVAKSDLDYKLTLSLSS